MNRKIFKSEKSLILESGEVLKGFTLAYNTFGSLNRDRSNVVWVCHALTANSNVEEWWPGLVGKGKLIDTDRYFVVCANMLGSCYGSTNPYDINPSTKTTYKDGFPVITIRDMVMSFRLLADHLKIDKIHCCLGGSTGGMQVVEWAIIDPKRFKYTAMLACDGVFSPWGIAFNESQRMALLSDSSIYEDNADAGLKGLATARTIAILSYRHYDVYQEKQNEKNRPIDNFRASSYQQYQGKKLIERFRPWCYYYLTKAMDSHNVGRGRSSIESALGCIEAETYVIGIDRDLLFPFHEQQFLADHISNVKLFQIESIYGHDAFLLEYDQLVEILKPIFK